MYRLVEVRLRNFKSHENTVIRIPTGSLALLGENGAGKSSILEAISLALTTSAGARLEQLVNERRGGRFSVTIVLEPIQGGGPRVEATVESGRGGSQYRLKVGGKLVASRQGDYKREISRILGLQHFTDPYSFIKRAVIVRQGGLQAIAEKMDSGKELRSEVEAAIGLPDYKKALENMEKVSLKAGLYPAKPTLHSLRNVEKMIQDARDRARKARAGLKEAKARIAELEEKIKELEAAIDKLIRDKAELEARAREAETIEGDLKTVRETIKRLEESRAQLEQELEEAERAGKEIPRLEELALLAPKLDEVYKAREAVARDKARVRELEAVVMAYRELERTRPAYEEYTRLEQLLQELTDKARELEARLAAARAEARNAAAKRRQSLGAVREAVKEAAAVPGHQARVETLEDAVKVLEWVKRRRRELEEELERLREEKAAAEARIRELAKVLDLVSRGRSSRCPVCGRELTEEHAREVKERTYRQIREERRRLEEAEKRLEEARRELDRLARIHDRLDRIIYRARKALEEAPSEDEIRRLEEEARSLEGELGKVKDQIRATRRRLEELKPARDRYAWAREQASSLPVHSLEEAERRLGELKRRLAETEERLRAGERSILEATGSKDLGEAARRIREAQERLGRLREVAAREPQVREQLDWVEREIQNYRSRVRSLEERLREAREAEGKLRAVEDEINRIQGELDKARDSLDKARGEAARLEAEDEEAKKRLQELERLKRLVKAGVAARNILSRLQETLYKRSLMLLEEEMSRILDSFNLDPARVEMVEERGGLRVKVLTRSGGERSISMLSGGERTSVALAYVLALNRIMDTRIGFLALDEPTSELDQERRQILMDLISRLSGADGIISQLVIVTHHEDVMDRVDTVCRVRKINGISRVECNEE